MEYYASLELKRNAQDVDIKQAYRRLAIQWHPDRNESQDNDMVTKKFNEVSEAYAVLVNVKLRTVYDQYGEKGLKAGIPNGRGGASESWSYTTNPVEQYEDFFGSFSPFADFFNEEAGVSKLLQDPNNKASPKLDAQVAHLFCTLEELHEGCTKKHKITRNKVTPDGKGVSPEETIMTVSVRAGWREGTKITFSGEGDEAVGYSTGDIVFILKEKPHPHFRRVKNDLYFTANISLLDALTGVTVSIKTLDGRVVPIPVNEIVRPGLLKRVPDEGMPLASNPKQRGNLIIDFNVTYPESLSDQQKYEIKETFARVEN